jgi:hypothetical protein
VMSMSFLNPKAGFCTRWFWSVGGCQDVPIVVICAFRQKSHAIVAVFSLLWVKLVTPAIMLIHTSGRSLTSMITTHIGTLDHACSWILQTNDRQIAFNARRPEAT